MNGRLVPTPRQAELGRLAELKRLTTYKTISPPPANEFGPELVEFFNGSVAKRHTKMGKLAEIWGALVPELLSEHCSLESYLRGVLTVVVDSASHLYELKQLLLAGLQNQILAAGKSTGLKKIVLKSGRWYTQEGRPKFNK